MRVEAENAIEDLLRKSGEALTFSEIKDETGMRGQDLRKALRFQITNGDVYVSGVKDKEKRYEIK